MTGSGTSMIVEAFAPGRVNLMGGPDYTGGRVLPMAIQLGTTVVLHAQPHERRIKLTSDSEAGTAEVGSDGAARETDAGSWARYVAAGVHAARPYQAGRGGVGRVSTTLPIGAGQSSSAALVASVAVALGLPTAEDGTARTAVESARRCQLGEQRAAGVPVGIMDQIACFAGVEGSILLLDCTTLELTPIRLPDTAQVVVAHCGQTRQLADSRYAERRAQCEAASREVGSLATAGRGALGEIRDPLVRRRARHVISERDRVVAAIDAVKTADLPAFGRLLSQSHASLARDFEVSTPALDSLVAALCDLPGVYGARLTGGGFGGCAVAVAERGAIELAQLPFRSSSRRVPEPAGGV